MLAPRLRRRRRRRHKLVVTRADLGIGDAIGQPRRRRAVLRPVREDRRVIGLDLAHEAEEVVEVLVRLAREARDEGRADRRVGGAVADRGDQALVGRARTGAAHQAEDVRRSVLEGEVEVGHDAVEGRHGLDRGRA